MDLLIFKKKTEILQKFYLTFLKLKKFLKVSLKASTPYSYDKIVCA